MFAGGSLAVAANWRWATVLTWSGSVTNVTRPGRNHDLPAPSIFMVVIPLVLRRSSWGFAGSRIPRHLRAVGSGRLVLAPWSAEQHLVIIGVNLANVIRPLRAVGELGAKLLQMMKANAVRGEGAAPPKPGSGSWWLLIPENPVKAMGRRMTAR